MAIRVNAKNQKTKDFLAYIVKTIAKKENLKVSDEIEILIQKGKTPFPEFHKYDQGLGSDYEAFEMQWKNDPSYDEKGNLIAQYLKNNLQNSAEIPLPERKGSKPLSFAIRIVVSDTFEIFKLHEKLKVEETKKKTLKTQKENSVPQFLENPPRILWGNKQIEIPKNSMEYNICKLSFDKIVGEEVSWDEIAVNVDGLSKKYIKTGRQSVYDAVKRINQKTMSAVNKKLFDWTNKAFIKIA